MKRKYFFLLIISILFILHIKPVNAELQLTYNLDKVFPKGNIPLKILVV